LTLQNKDKSKKDAQEIKSTQNQPLNPKIAAHQLIDLYNGYLKITKRLIIEKKFLPKPQKIEIINIQLRNVIARMAEINLFFSEKHCSKYSHNSDLLALQQNTANSNEWSIDCKDIYTIFNPNRLERLKQLQKWKSETLVKKFEKNEYSDKKNLVPDRVYENNESMDQKEIYESETKNLITIQTMFRRFRSRLSFIIEFNRFSQLKSRADKMNKIKESFSNFSDTDAQTIIAKYLRRNLANIERIKLVDFKVKFSRNLAGPNLLFDFKTTSKQPKQKIFEKFNELSIKCRDELENIREEIRQKMLKNESVEIGERLEEEIYQWFIEYREANGKFPAYPTDDEGGSRALFTRSRTVDQLKDEFMAKSQGDAKSSKTEPNATSDQSIENYHTSSLKQSCSKYLSDWAGYDRESVKSFLGSGFACLEPQANNSPYENIGIDINQIEKQTELLVEDEIRKKVDENMRTELEKLRATIDGEKPPKAKKAGKKASRATKSGKKKGKDLTPGSTDEQLFKILCENNLIIIPDQKWPSIDDLITSHNYLGAYTQLSGKNQYLQPCFRDIVNYIKEKHILQIACISESSNENIMQASDGQKEAKQFSGFKKSLLITGPKGVGKHSLFKSICKDLGAFIIDLSASKLTGEKFVEKDELKMLMHLVSKVSHLLKPCIIFIDQSDLMFRKKAPKYEDGTDPKRLKKELPKLLKSFEFSDQVLIIGITDCPWEADIKQMMSLYQDVVIVPSPDHAMRLDLIQKLSSSHNVFFDENTLANVANLTDGYSLKNLQNIFKLTMLRYDTTKVNRQMTKNILSDFIRHLSAHAPCDADNEIKFAEWFKKIPENKLIENFLGE